MTLAEMHEGQKAVIARIHGRGVVRQRLMDMGVTRGSELRVERYAPLKDPIEISVRGFLLALRIEEARDVEVHVHEPRNHRQF